MTHNAQALRRKLLVVCNCEKNYDAFTIRLQVAKWEQKLNALVYELYGLTKDEIRMVERRVN